MMDSIDDNGDSIGRMGGGEAVFQGSGSGHGNARQRRRERPR